MGFKAGLLAATAGTIALDAVSYADMLLRGRPASELPTEVVKKLAPLVGWTDILADDEATANKRSALGALLGYANGMAAGAVYGAIRPAFRWVPWPIAGLILGGATLVTSEGLATQLGATDWSTWSAGEWIADIIPRSIYGLTVAAVIEAIDPEIDEELEAVVTGFVEEITSPEPIEPPIATVGATENGFVDDTEIEDP